MAMITPINPRAVLLILILIPLTLFAEEPLGHSKVIAPVPGAGLPEGIATRCNRFYVSGPADFGQPLGSAYVHAYDIRTGALEATFPIDITNPFAGMSAAIARQFVLLRAWLTCGLSSEAVPTRASITPWGEKSPPWTTCRLKIYGLNRCYAGFPRASFPKQFLLLALTWREKPRQTIWRKSSLKPESRPPESPRDCLLEEAWSMLTNSPCFGR